MTTNKQKRAQILGLVKVEVWVPEKHVTEVRRFAKDLTEHTLVSVVFATNRIVRAATHTVIKAKDSTNE